MNKPEILAPVGAMPQLIAAVRSGADAVYMGTKNFNARRNAENISDLKEAVAYCHARGVRVYVTFNTLLLEKEIDAAANEAKYIVQCGVDAVILQDLAAAEIFKQVCPTLPLHASTQMSIHNLAGVQMLEKLGFSRVVLAREMSKKEIRYIAENSSMELEVFIHGAHCMSVSGQCYMSSVLGLRSGNRGLCAQPCRLDWRLGKKNYALSLKDLSLMQSISELAEIGVCSLKIEGRMKRPEYVASAVRECIRARNGEKPDMQLLGNVFSRSGFTDGYFRSRRNAQMFGRRTDEDAAKTASVLKNIENSYRNEAQLIGISMQCEILRGRETKLTISDGKNNATVFGSKAQEAMNAAATVDSVKSALEKCGGTIFYAENIKVDLDDGLFIPKSELNALRQKALAELMSLREKLPEREVFDYKKKEHSEHIDKKSAEYRLILSDFSQFDTKMADIASMIALYPKDILNNKEALAPYREKIAVRMPAFVGALDEKSLCESLTKIRELGIKHGFAGNLGMIRLLADAGFNIHGTHNLNITNGIALETYKELGLTDAEVSFEADMRTIGLIKKSLPLGILAYGYLPLMLLRSCPNANEKGCSSCNGKAVLTDRKNKRFPLLCHEKKYQELLNSCPLWLGDKKSDLEKFDHIDLLFTKETKEECLSVIEQYSNAEKADGEFTRGLYYREIL